MRKINGAAEKYGTLLRTPTEMQESARTQTKRGRRKHSKGYCLKEAKGTPGRINKKRFRHITVKNAESHRQGETLESKRKGPFLFFPLLGESQSDKEQISQQKKTEDRRRGIIIQNAQQPTISHPVNSF